MAEKNYILNREVAMQKLHRMALELAENLSGDTTPVVIIGIRNSGMVIAEKVGTLLKQYVANEVKIISVMMDKTHPTTVELSEKIDFNQLHVVIADDIRVNGNTSAAIPAFPVTPQ